MNWRVDIEARRGDFNLCVDIGGDRQPVALVGRNGSGKTTLLRMIAGADQPDSGVIDVGDARFFEASTDTATPIEQRRIGYVPQGYGLFGHLTALENVAFGLSTSTQSQPKKQRRRRARSMLDEVGCDHLAERRPRHLSGGEQQRVALARALVVEPRMLLLDEPLAAVDIAGRRQLRRFLARRIAGLGCPSIVVTHDVREISALDASVCVLEAGRVVQVGRLAELRRMPANDFVAELVADIEPASN